jgi:quinol monooxygenase YgiN
MPIVRLIFVKGHRGSQDGGVDLERELRAMMQQPSCLSEKLLRSSDGPGEFISYSGWEDQQSIDPFRLSEGP